ncbi:hypothetical protein SDC9_149755 [bioreactor metagenome]|uniref:Uncharacterized protein n=1 Tax=bioreactor metagenome TaxID=1076179 RepID=A0A645EN36_9ZZZZ
MLACQTYEVSLPAMDEFRSLRAHRYYIGRRDGCHLRTGLCCPGPYYSQCRFFAQCHHRYAFFYYAGLLGSDLLYRIPQILRVLKAYVGYHRDLRHYHIGGVVSSAHPYFDDRVLRPFVSEMHERYRRRHFEEGAHHAPGGHLLHLRPQLRNVVCQLLIRYLHPVHAYALVEPLQVRRGVEPGPYARLAEHGCCYGGYRALPVGTGHMYASKSVLRVPQSRQQHADVPEAQLHPVLLKPVQPIQGFGIRLQTTSPRSSLGPSSL